MAGHSASRVNALMSRPSTSYFARRKTWMHGTRPGMTSRESCAYVLALGSRHPQRGLQRPLRLARTLAERMLQITQLRPRSRERLRLDRPVGSDQVLSARRELGAATLRT